MAVDLFQTIAEKRNALTDQKVRFESLLERTEAARKGGQTISFPEFEAFGWEHFEEFLNRFEDSLNSPLLERACGILEKVSVTVSPQMIEKLKPGLTVRREKLVEILEQMARELKTIAIVEVQEKTKQDIIGCLEQGTWDSLIEKVNQWYQLEQHLAPIAEERDKSTLLYNAVLDLAFQEGPLTKVVYRLRELENIAYQLGGDIVKQQIKFEAPESSANPLASVESNLTKIAQRKEDLRQLQGEDVLLDNLVRKDSTLKGVIDTLEKVLKTVGENFSKENRHAKEMLEKHNNLAALLKQSMRSLPADLNMKRLKVFVTELEMDIEKLSKELEKSLTPDARIFIENVIDGKLPTGWKEGRIVLAIQELLEKGFCFEVRRRE